MPDFSSDPGSRSPERSRKPLYIGLAIVTLIVVLLETRRAAILSSVGNSGGAVGALIGPFIWYAVVQFLITFAYRKIGHPETRFATSRLNYATAALVVFAVLGSVARPIAA